VRFTLINFYRKIAAKKGETKGIKILPNKMNFETLACGHFHQLQKW
jgi:hypothetical protein